MPVGIEHAAFREPLMDLQRIQQRPTPATGCVVQECFRTKLVIAVDPQTDGGGCHADGGRDVRRQNVDRALENLLASGLCVDRGIAGIARAD